MAYNQRISNNYKLAFNFTRVRSAYTVYIPGQSVANMKHLDEKICCIHKLVTRATEILILTSKRIAWTAK